LFDPYIGTRASAVNPSVLEYYNKATNIGFDNPDHHNQNASQVAGTPITSFSQLHAPVHTLQGANQGGNGINLTDPNQQIAGGAGSAGLSPTDYQNLAQAENPLTQDQVNAILQGLGIPTLEQQTFTLPQQNTQDLYNQAYGAANLGDLKAKIAAITDEINQRKNDYVQAQGAVNENPFLDEASRTGRIGRLNDQAGKYINNLISQQGQLQDLYDKGVSEVNGVVTRHTNDFTLAQQTNTAKLNYLLQKAEQQKSLAASSNISKALRYLPDYLKSKVAANTQQTFTTPNGAVYRWDVKSGQFQQVAAPNAPKQAVPNALSGGVNVFDPASGTLLPAGSSGGASVSIPQNIQQGTGQPQLAYQNNNPGNLRFVGQPGATQGAGGFAKFNSPQEGYQALLNQVQLDQSRGGTLAAYITKYAPPGENNTAQYIQQAAQALGVDPNAPLSSIDANKIAAFQAQKESGAQISQQTPGTNQLLQSYTDHTPDGYKYIDQSKLEGTQKDAITYLARQAGVPILNGDEVAKVKAIQASELNLGNIQNAALGFLPSDPLSRVVVGPSNKLADFFQTNSDISAFNAWRSAVINNVQALAGGAGSGLRINQAEIDTALKNDLPEITDTAATAQSKIATLKSQLTTWKTVIFGSQPQANAAAIADISNLF